MRGRRRSSANGRIWLGVLLLVVGAVVVVVIAATRSSTGAGAGAPRLSASVQAQKLAARHHRRPAHSRLLRNATPQPGWRKYTGPVPFLVYHALGPAPPGAPFPLLYVSYGDFTAEMAWLHAHGYQAVTIDEVMRAWYHGGTLPAKPIVITFDNGYPEQVTFAPHVMARYGWPGVLNEITENHLVPRQIWPIIHLGWEVDSHSLTHPELTTAPPAELWAQVHGSRAYLRRTFHVPVNSFCYPSSHYNAAVIAAVKRAGYTNAVTEGDAYATRADPYLLPRFEIEGGVSELAADLRDTQPPGYGTA
ncbi:MAG TPA: polysaccharide deacetylase family protein [Solirubrobacteraceae bacterium]|nr:polysaccharide deacetylase family protein [Solirubrobacteraceae bacterium]